MFETEDQRNWADGSFKTYCRPLDRPFPYDLSEGERVWQRVAIRVRGGAPSAAGPPPPTLTIGRPLARLPLIGFALPDGTDMARADGFAGPTPPRRRPPRTPAGGDIDPQPDRRGSSDGPGGGAGGLAGRRPGNRRPCLRRRGPCATPARNPWPHPAFRPLDRLRRRPSRGTARPDPAGVGTGPRRRPRPRARRGRHGRQLCGVEPRPPGSIGRRRIRLPDLPPGPRDRRLVAGGESRGGRRRGAHRPLVPRQMGGSRHLAPDDPPPARPVRQGQERRAGTRGAPTRDRRHCWGRRGRSSRLPVLPWRRPMRSPATTHSAPSA